MSSEVNRLQRGELGTRGLHKGPGFALYAVLDFAADNYQPIVAKFEQDFEAIETAISLLGCVIVYRRLRRDGWV